ncbi:NCS1 family nucleobase:cation symporter-1 [Paraburkholderia sediminicola]|uniref:NCS1 family nucleobase:cation symporter-1 n=1 Tax=Paraburkholderia sediminicola TaxID=458836 RepID=UPI0038BAE9B3
MESTSRLFNDDIAPSTERRWGVFSLTSVWFSLLHNIGVYTAAAGMLVIGLPAWQAVTAFMLGLLMTCVGAQMIGVVGQRHGVPFPVLARVSFGVYGANLPALVRAAVALAWYGIQTYLASRAVIVLAVSIAPAWRNYDTGGAFGLSALGWWSFMLLWALQLAVMAHGIETIRKFQNYAGAMVSLVMILLAVLIYAKAGGHINWQFGRKAMSAREHAALFSGTVAMFFSMFSTLLLNFCDFSRFSKSTRDVALGNILGLLVNGIVFSTLVVVVTVGGLQVYGQVMTEPTEILAATGNRIVMAVGATLFIFATVGVNVIANAVSSAYDFASIFPKHINFTRGALVTAVLSIFVMPWKLFSSPVAITYFLGSIGALLGPIFGIMMVDYFFIRRGRIDTQALYSDRADGAYQYRKGWNSHALIAMLLASIASVSMTVAPGLSMCAPYSWFAGALVAGGVYVLSSAGRRELLLTTDEELG